jgi:hypothetical protein
VKEALDSTQITHPVGAATLCSVMFTVKRYTLLCYVHCKALHFVVLCSLKNAVLPSVLLTTNTVCRCSSISACIYH